MGCHAYVHVSLLVSVVARMTHHIFPCPSGQQPLSLQSSC